MAASSCNPHLGLHELSRLFQHRASLAATPSCLGSAVRGGYHASPATRRRVAGGHAAAIDRAFRGARLAAVAIVVNSPGGSPVQSALLYRRIRQLAEEKSIPVIAFAEDVAASGGYWLALAGDEIFGEETSLLGSIGVISAGFGFYQLIGRLGVERRLHTAGERKSLLDPFLPEEPSTSPGSPHCSTTFTNRLRNTCAVAVPARSMRRMKPCSPATY